MWHDIYRFVLLSCVYYRIFRFVFSNQKQYFQRKAQNSHLRYTSANSSISLVSRLPAQHLVVWTGKLISAVGTLFSGSENCLSLVATVPCVRWRWLSLVWGFLTFCFTSFAVQRLGNILRPSESQMKFLYCYQRHTGPGVA
jgi:hypothetical protein